MYQADLSDLADCLLGVLIVVAYDDVQVHVADIRNLLSSILKNSVSCSLIQIIDCCRHFCDLI